MALKRIHVSAVKKCVGMVSLTGREGQNKVEGVHVKEGTEQFRGNDHG